MHGAHHDTHAGMHPMRACNTCRTHAALVNVEVGAERSAAARKACDEPKKCASTLKNAKGSVAQKNSSCSGVAMSLPRDKPSREAREAQRRRPPPSSARANRRAGAAAATAAAIVDDHLRVGGAPTEASPEQRDDVHVLALAERHRRVVAPSRRKPARLATRGRPQASEADSPATATSHENYGMAQGARGRLQMQHLRRRCCNMASSQLMQVAWEAFCGQPWKLSGVRE